MIRRISDFSTRFSKPSVSSDGLEVNNLVIAFFTKQDFLYFQTSRFEKLIEISFVSCNNDNENTNRLIAFYTATKMKERI